MFRLASSNPYFMEETNEKGGINPSIGIKNGYYTSEGPASPEMFFRMRIYDIMKSTAGDSIVTDCHFSHTGLWQSIHYEDFDVSTVYHSHLATPILDPDQKRAATTSSVHTDRAISKLQGY